MRKPTVLFLLLSSSVVGIAAPTVPNGGHRPDRTRSAKRPAHPQSHPLPDRRMYYPGLPRAYQPDELKRPLTRRKTLVTMADNWDARNWTTQAVNW